MTTNAISLYIGYGSCKMHGLLPEEAACISIILNVTCGALIKLSRDIASLFLVVSRGYFSFFVGAGKLAPLHQASEFPLS